MKPKVYIETTIVSYLTARPSRDVIVAAHQQLTDEWWHTRRPAFDLLTSRAVVEEAGFAKARSYSCKGCGGCRTCRCFGRIRLGLFAYVELPAHCKRSNEKQDRASVSFKRVPAADYVYT